MVNLQGILNDDTHLNNELIYDFKSNFLYKSFYSDILNDFDINCSYIFENECSQYLASLKNLNLSVLGINAQSINAKFNEIKNLLDNLSQHGGCVDILAISESWVSDFSIYSVPNYDCYGSSRPSGRGGGSALYIKSSFSSKRIEHKSFFIPHFLEATTVELNLKNYGKILIISCYRPNCHDDFSYSEQANIFLEKLDHLLEYIDSFSCPKIFIGDLNLDILKSIDINNHATLMLDAFTFHGFIQIISRATRVTDSSYSLIDNIFIKDLVANIENTFVLQSDLSDHFPVMSIFNLSKDKIKAAPPPPSRNFNENNKIAFLRALESLNWRSVLELECPNMAYDRFYVIFKDLFDINFPLVEHRVNRKYIPLNPFMSAGLLKCRSKKQKLAIFSKKYPTPENKNKYLSYRNVYNSLIRTAKKLFHRKKIREAGNDGKKVWNVLKNSMGIPEKSSKINSLNTGQGEISTNLDIANFFNSHFSSIGNRLTPLVPTTDKNFNDYLPAPCQRSFFIFPVDEVLMENYIRSIKPKKSCDVNGVNMNLLHFVAKPLSRPLSHIFNQSVAFGVFPENLKTSRTIPIFKSGDRSDPENYRGVSITDSFSKPFEKIMSEKLLIFLEQNNFFYANQYGFRPKFSTNHAILAILNFISKSLNSGKFVLLVLLDIRKCFDMLNHDILLKKLENYGVRGLALQWFKSYFSGRKQRVFANGVLSSTLCDILLGVLQGSILGVLLFLIFINDIFMANDDMVSYLFADDNSAATSDSDLVSLIEKANIELNKLLNWYNSNMLLIHPGKTKSLLFHPPRTDLNLNKDAQGQYILPVFLNMNNVNENNITKISQLRLIPNTDDNYARLLGVLIDEKLELKHHLKHVHSKVSRAIFSLNQMKHILDKAHLKILYFSYVKSQIDYCSNIFMLANQYSLKPIFLLQKRAIRIICGTGFRDHTLNLFKDEKILPINETVKFNALKFMFDYRNNLLPSSFSNTWQKNSDVFHFALRNKDDFYREHTIAKYLQNHPLFYFPSLWNSLLSELSVAMNVDLKIIDSRKLFSNKVFDGLIETLNF